jgi:hypothetical protein
VNVKIVSGYKLACIKVLRFLFRKLILNKPTKTKKEIGEMNIYLAINIHYDERREERCIMKSNASSAVISIIAHSKLTMIDNGPLNCLTFPFTGEIPDAFGNGKTFTDEY